MVAQRRRRVLRGYTDLTLIRSGRLWTLYRAFDVESSQWVAMRVIPAGAAESYLLDELTDEINAFQPVSRHPNLATIHRLLRRRDGSVTLVTELCRGSVADIHSHEGVVPVAQAVKAAREAASGLEAIHAVGLTHRDVRPSKLMVSRSGTTVVEGLGLAVLGVATRTPSTPVNPHGAPEIFEAKAASPATDVYGLASALYELIHGRPAFEAFEGEPPASLILRIVGEAPPTLRGPGVPLVLSDLIARSMSKEPSERPTTVRELADELERIALPGRPTHDVDDVAVPDRSGGAPAAPPPRAGVRAEDARRPSRTVLTPLTAGRGAPPVVPHRDTAEKPHPQADVPEFTDPNAPQQPAWASAGSSDGDQKGVRSGSTQDPPLSTPRALPPATDHAGVGHVLRPVAWVLLSLAAIVVVVAVLVALGVR